VEIRREVKNVNRRDQMCIVLRHDSFPNTELHAVERWVCVTTAAASTFDSSGPTIEESTTEVARPPGEQTALGDTINDAHQYLREGFSVDDDTLPNEENIGPGIAATTTNTWGWDGIDPHKQGNNHRTDPVFNGDPNRPIDTSNLLMTIFINMLPWDYLTSILLVETNKNMTTKVTIGELLKFIGL